MCDVWYNEHTTGQDQHSGIGTKKTLYAFMLLLLQLFCFLLKRERTQKSVSRDQGMSKSGGRK